MELEEICSFLNAKRSGNCYTARCPAHEDRDPSLSISTNSEGKLLLHCHAGCEFDEILLALGMDPSVKRKHYHSNIQPVDYEKNIQKMTDLWAGTVHVLDCPDAVAYLDNRHVLREAAEADSEKFRAHPSIPYWDTSGDKPELMGEYAALCAIVEAPNGDIASIHRTYLLPSGQKVPFGNARKMMSSAYHKATKNSRIQLFPATDVLAVAEGIESALAFKNLMKRKNIDVPVWSCISAQGLQNFQCPRTVETVFIVGDNDKSRTGQDAAYRLKDQLFEITDVHVCIPSNEGEDMADVLAELENARQRQA